jgi:hypothetical protein
MNWVYRNSKLLNDEIRKRISKTSNFKKIIRDDKDAMNIEMLYM